MTLRALSLVAFGLVLATAQSARPWTYASSDHFEVYTTAGERRAREVLVDFEGVRAFLSGFLNLAPARANSTRLIVFSNDREYAPYRPNDVATAFYQSGPERDVIVMRSLQRESYPVVVHEYMHLIIRHSGADYPLWLNEGLAEFFSTMAPEGNGMALGRVPPGRLLHLSSGPGLFDLTRLFAIDTRSPEYSDKTHAGLFYSQSWALTHMLLADDRYRAASGRFLSAVASGTPAAAALESAYGRPLAAVASDLSGYIRRDRYQYFLVSYTKPQSALQAPVREADAFEAGLALANVLAARTGAEAGAEAAFETLARERPDDLTLAESRAWFEYRRGRRDEARVHMAKAVALGSRRAELYRDYAQIARVDDLETAERLLTAGMALAPDDLDLRISYAAILVQRDKGLGALAALHGITRVPPDSAFMLFQVLAQAYAQVGNLDDARTAAGKMIQAAKPGDEERFARRILQQLDDYAARRASVDQSVRAARDAAEAAARARANVVASPASAPPAKVETAAAPTAGPTGVVRVLVAQGHIRNVICGADRPIVEVAVANETLRLAVDDPKAIKVQGTGAVTADLSCGPQDRAVRIGYLPVADSARKTSGLVRLLDFRGERQSRSWITASRLGRPPPGSDE